jgi:dTDP-4-amino-4,6-dideoxygalactose transaminase
MCVTAETVKAALTPKTKAVIAVHLFGNVAPIAEIEALGVPVLEDAAQAAGSTSLAGRPGALGTIATFSFYPSKNLGAFGDGGAITTRDAELADRVRTLRFHGSKDKKDYVEIGYNSRLDEMQAAILRVQLPYVDAWAAARGAAGDRYAEALQGVVALPKPTQGSRPAWHLYVVRHDDPDTLLAALTDAGIGARAYYRVPVHAQPPMAKWAPAHDLPGTAEAARTHLAIPMSAALDAEQVDRVVAAIRSAVVATR